MRGTENVTDFATGRPAMISKYRESGGAGIIVEFDQYETLHAMVIAMGLELELYSDTEYYPVTVSIAPLEIRGSIAFRHIQYTPAEIDDPKDAIRELVERQAAGESPSREEWQAALMR